MFRVEKVWSQSKTQFYINRDVIYSTWIDITFILDILPKSSGERPGRTCVSILETDNGMRKACFVDKMKRVRHSFLKHRLYLFLDSVFWRYSGRFWQSFGFWVTPRNSASSTSEAREGNVWDRGSASVVATSRICCTYLVRSDISNVT